MSHVFGPDAGLEYANRRGIAALFIMRKGDDFQERMTPAFEELLAQ